MDTENKKVYVVGGSISYTRFIDNAQLVDSLEEADIVLFTGGEDVTPSYYGKQKHESTYCNPQRDAIEKEYFDRIQPNQIALGVCRGSQFLCVMNGGLLVQNCRNHGIYGTHKIIDKDGREFEITSTHHQMQYPYNLDKKDYTVLFKSSENRSPIYEGDGIDGDIIIKLGEPEIVKYHKEGKPVCLAIQGHPEVMEHSQPVINEINKILNLC